MSEEQDRKRGCDAFLVLVIACCAMIGASVGVVEPNQFAFDFFDTYKTVDDSTVYEQGRHFLGIGHSFISFPSNEVKMDVEEMTIRTKDGLRVSADIVFWYKIEKGPVAMKLITEFGYEYETVFRLMVRSELRDIAAEFSGTELTSKREIIADMMRTGIKTLLGDLDVGIEVTQVFLKSIFLPSQFNQAIAATVVAQQDVFTAQSEVEVKKIAADTETQEAAISSEKFVLEAKAVSESAMADAEADADISIKRAATRANAYAELSRQAGLANIPITLTANELLAYVFVDNVRNDGDSAITLGLDEPVLA